VESLWRASHGVPGARKLRHAFSYSGLLCKSLIVVATLCACHDVGGAAEVTAATATSPDKPAQHFDVREYRVLGNTVLSNRQIEGVLYPRLGSARTFDDVEAARAALEAAYHALGYATVFVDIPPQEVTEGVVRLHVTEGRLRERTISGARYFSEGRILAQLPATEPGVVPKLNDLQQQLNAVNAQSADRSVVPVLRAGPVPGTMDLALKVDDHLPLHGNIEFDNQNTPDSKPLRATFGLSYNNLFNDLDGIMAQYTVAPQKWSQVGVLNAGYYFHPLGDGIRPSISFTNSSSNVATVGTLGVLGKGQIIGARLSEPLLELPGNTQSLTFGVDYKHFHNTLDLNTTGVQIEASSYLNASLAYNGVWQRLAPSGSLLQTGSVNLTANLGPRGIANSDADFQAGRIQGRGNYAYLRLEGAFTTRLPLDLELILRAAGQAALEQLIVYEQESISGADGVRGYLEAEDLGDTAVKGTVQLQSPAWSRHGYSFGDAFVFFDAGQSHYIDALAGEPDNVELRSLGAGLDLLPGHSVTGSLTWADPLLPGPRTRAHDSRVLFDLKGSF
jgi:hemolysin activation/secretion protein